MVAKFKYFSLFILIGFINIAPANAQIVGNAVNTSCNKSFSQLLGMLPPLPGISDLNQTLNLAAKLQKNGLPQSDNEFNQMFSLLDQIDPTGMVNQLSNLKDNVGNTIDLKTTGILAGSINNLLAGTNLERFDSQLRAMYLQLENQAKNEGSAVAKAAIYSRMTKINGIIGSWSGVRSGTSKANSDLDAVLAQSDLASISNTIGDILNAAQNPSGSADQIANLLGRIKGLDLSKVSVMRDQLDDICGMLPDGQMKNKLLGLADSLANGDFAAAETLLKDYLKNLAKDKISDALNKLPSGAAKNALTNALAQADNSDWEGMARTLGEAGLQSALAGQGLDGLLGDLSNLGNLGTKLKDLTQNGGILKDLSGSLGLGNSRPQNTVTCQTWNETDKVFDKLFNKTKSTRDDQDHYLRRQPNFDPCRDRIGDYDKSLY